MPSIFQDQTDEIRRQERADTLAKVVAWLEREADKIRYRHPDACYALQRAADTLEAHPEVLDASDGERGEEK